MLHPLSFTEHQSRLAGRIAAIDAIEAEADRLERRHVATLCNRASRIQRSRRSAN
jgi:hypothetical protein